MKKKHVLQNAVGKNCYKKITTRHRLEIKSSFYHLATLLIPATVANNLKQKFGDSGATTLKLILQFALLLTLIKL